MSVDALVLRFIRLHPADAARTLESGDVGELAGFLSELPSKEAASVVNLLLPQTGSRCLSIMVPGLAAEIIGQVDADAAAILLRRMDRHTQSEILSAVPPGRAAALRTAMRFPDGVVGAVMDPEVPALNDDMRVSDAIAAVQSYSSNSHERLYLIDRNRLLTGTVDFRKLLVAYPEMPIRDLGERPEHTLPARASLVTVRDHPVWQQRQSVPVVDRGGVLLGVISRDRVLAAADTMGRAGGDEVTEFLFSFSEALWGACAELFVRAEGSAERREGT